MSSPARTPAAGSTSPVWPTRPVPPTVPSTARRDLVDDATPAAGGPPTPSPRSSEVPLAPAPTAEQRALDPRTIARASLAAGRNRSLFWTLGGIGATVLVAFWQDAVVAAYALALLLVVYAVVRLLGPAQGPVAVTVRSKALDVTLLLSAATALVALAALVPTTA